MAQMPQNNMYRVGGECLLVFRIFLFFCSDYVYFETYPAAPYQIRRIEELNKTLSGAVEAKVTCFFRRRDLPRSLLKIADQAERQSKICKIYEKKKYSTRTIYKSFFVI